jgi:hypothetical protein
MSRRSLSQEPYVARWKQTGPGWVGEVFRLNRVALSGNAADEGTVGALAFGGETVFPLAALAGQESDNGGSALLLAAFPGPGPPCQSCPGLVARCERSMAHSMRRRSRQGSRWSDRTFRESHWRGETSRDGREFKVQMLADPVAAAATLGVLLERTRRTVPGESLLK